MNEKFSRTSYDRHNVSKTEYNVEDSRSGIKNLDAAAERISSALSAGKEFVLPGEIVNKIGLCENFYLTRLPYMEALRIFFTSIEANYFRELMRRYPNDPQKRAQLAGINKKGLEAHMSKSNLSSSPLPVSYNLRPFKDKSFPTIEEIRNKNEEAFSRLYIEGLRKRTGNNFEEMLKLSGTTKEHLGGLLRRFP